MSGRGPRALGFDYGGTLVAIGHPGNLLTEAGEEVLERLQLVSPQAIEGTASFGQKVDSLVDQLIAEAHARDPLREVDIYAIYQLALNQLLGAEVSSKEARLACHLLQKPWEGAITVTPGVGELLGQLKARGLTLGLLSNAPYPADLMHGMLERQGLARWFDVVLFSSELGVRKPAPGAFSALLQALRVDAAQSWFIGDEEDADLRGAAAAGMTPVAAPRVETAETFRRSALSSWGELLRRLDGFQSPG